MRMVPLVALLVLSTPATAQQTPATPDAAQQQPAQPAKQVCRRYNTTGSIMPGKRVCHTVAEWRKIDEGSDADTWRNRPLTPSNGPNG